MNIQSKATWELKAIIRALSFFQILNTPEETQRLEDAKTELQQRSKR